MDLLIINGPNINLLGLREPEVYGSDSYEDLLNLLDDYAVNNNHNISVYQSNHEGEIVDLIQSEYLKYDALIINPAAYTHTSIAIRDAIVAVGIDTVEVHISDVNNREDFRKVNYYSDIALCTISNEGIKGYLSAIKYLEGRLDDN